MIVNARNEILMLLKSVADLVVNAWTPDRIFFLREMVRICSKWPVPGGAAGECRVPAGQEEVKAGAIC